MLVALAAGFIATGWTPRLAFQESERGQGRLMRIYSLINDCRVSVHDLSIVRPLPRFNMPFELGMACARKMQSPLAHDFLVLDRKPLRLQRHLSDLAGIDPKIHHGTPIGVISAILDVFARPDQDVAAVEVHELYKLLSGLIPNLKVRHGSRDLYNARVFEDLVAIGRAMTASSGGIRLNTRSKSGRRSSRRSARRFPPTDTSRSRPAWDGTKAREGDQKRSHASRAGR